MGKKIGIIGAGYAGVASARVLKAFGYDVVVYEKEPDIGGVWSSSRRYPSLTTQNPKDTYYLSELPMPKHFPDWPSGKQVQEYMENYVETFDFGHTIKTNCEVISASLDQANYKWCLKVRQLGSGDLEQAILEDTVDYLIVCNGIFSLPFVPAYEGKEAFQAAGGKLLHTSEFTDVESARDKDIVIIGYGKSSCDVARASLGISKSTTLVARNLIWKIPKKLMNFLNYKYLFLTRMGEGLFKYIRVRGFEKFLHSPIGRPIRNGMMATVQFIVTKQLKLKEIGLHPGKPLETIARSTVSLVSDGFYEAVKSGDLRMIKSTSITSLEPGKAHLSNGETIPADFVVCGTGWRQEVAFFDDDMLSRVTDHDGNFRLYRSMIPVDVPNLAFNGYNSSFFSQLNCEVGALWIVDHLKGGISLPSTHDQNRSIDVRLAWMKERTDGKHSKGTNIIPFSVHHLDELLADMGLTLNLFTRFKQWFAPVDPRQYSSLLARLLKRYSK